MSQRPFYSLTRKIPRSGVIEVMTRAQEHGFTYGDEEWANLGQGSPETGHIADGIERVESISIDQVDQTYAPVSGKKELRQRIADIYNDLYRKDKESQYTWENVSVVGGGRAALSRIFAALKRVNVGYFIPDYASYEGLLSTFRSFTPMPIMRDSDTDYRVDVKDLDREVWKYHLQAILTSNPCNPTGQLIAGQELKDMVDLCREKECALIIDEFYSSYIYSDQGTDHNTVSAAEYVEDVNEEATIIVNGLTKNWRYPGWRTCWIVGPKAFIETVDSAGSFLDGGTNNPLQTAAIELMTTEKYVQETKAVQAEYTKKRDYLYENLTRLGFDVQINPEGAFYMWARLHKLPEPLRDCFDFLEECLKEKVIVVPGTFFDLSPRRERSLDDARFHTFVRLSFGPDMATLERGIAAFERVIEKHK